MKKNLLVATLLLMITVFDLNAAASIGSWRFRNDDGSESTATWKAVENDSIVQKDESNIRLRMEFIEGTLKGYSDSIALYYKPYMDENDTLWHLVTNNPDEAFMFSLSPNIENYNFTYEQLTTSSLFTYLVGVAFEEPGFISVSIGDETRTELEYCIKASPNADFNKPYIFNIDQADTAIADWEQESLLPRIYLQKPILTVTASNASRKTGQDNPASSLSYSGFVDGDNESVLNTIPQKVCAANTASPAGTYDIVPYGAADNKYDFAYVTGKLTVTAASGINDNLSQELSVYPNPASDIIHLNGETPMGAYARIFDLSGRLVLEQLIDGQEIDIHQLSNGAYMLNVGSSVYKIIKK